jgi:hypothetical protein
MAYDRFVQDHGQRAGLHIVVVIRKFNCLGYCGVHNADEQ